MGEVFTLTFNDNGVKESIVLENEPIGYDSVNFSLEQEEDRYGRDVYFAGNAQFQLEFTEDAHFEVFDKLVDFYDRFGFESDVVMTIQIGQETFIGNLDFLTSEFNGHDHFKFNVLQQTKEALVKKRVDLVVDLFADKDMDGNPSTPATKQQMLLPAKLIYRESVWENPEPTSIPIGFGVINYSSSTTKSDIKNTLSFIPGYYPESFTNMQSFQMLNAITDLLDLELSIQYNGSWIRGNLISQLNRFQLVIRKGLVASNQQEWDDGEFYLIEDINMFSNNQIFLQDKTVKFSDLFIDPVVRNGEGIWIYFYSKIFIDPGQMFYNNIKYTIKAYEQNFDVITPCVSIFDACEKVIRDISGLSINFPMAKSGELKNHFIFSGNMVRGINKPFLVSFEDLKKWFPELNLDYEIMANETVYIGHYKDFYTNNEIDAIDNVAFDSYGEFQNEVYALNKLTYKYNKYQSQKENTEEDTNDIVHGEAEYHVQNIQVENGKNIEVSFVRDPFLLQETINTALKESDNKATQDDDTIYIIDGANMNTADYNKIKTSMLYHTQVSSNRLKLSNNGNFRWDLLGITLTSTFEITTTQNRGVYLVVGINPSELLLIVKSPYPNNITFIGEAFTAFKYTINQNNVKLKPFVYSNGGIATIEGVKSPETYANLRFSIGLNLRNYWREFISATSKNLKPVQQIKYINNKEYFNTFVTPFHKESDDIFIRTPLLDTKIIETKLIIDFERYLRICKVLRSTDRGFIRTFNPRMQPVYIYPQNMSAIHKSSGLKEVTVKGEVKFVPVQVDITKTGGMYNIWIHRFMTFSMRIDGEYIIFLDANNVAFFRRSHYTNVKVNGLNYGSALEVINAVNAL